MRCMKHKGLQGVSVRLLTRYTVTPMYPEASRYLSGYGGLLNDPNKFRTQAYATID